MASLTAIGTSTPASQTPVVAHESKSEATRKFGILVIPDCECQVVFKVYKKIVSFGEALKKERDLVWLHTTQRLTKPTILHVTVPEGAKARKIFAKRNDGHNDLITLGGQFWSEAVKVSANQIERGDFEKTKALLPKDTEEQTIVIDGAELYADESTYANYVLPKIGDGVL
jgi:hypothetical protein